MRKKNEEIIGFIYGRIYFDCDIIPIDIEITLGFNQSTNSFEINVLDFGMTFDKKNIHQNPMLPRNTGFFAIYHNGLLDNKEKESQFLQLTLDDIDIDLYSDINGKGLSSFMYASQLNICPNCTEYYELKRNTFSYACYIPRKYDV